MFGQTLGRRSVSLSRETLRRPSLFAFHRNIRAVCVVCHVAASLDEAMFSFSGTIPSFAVHFRSNAHTMPNYRLPPVLCVMWPRAQTRRIISFSRKTLRRPTLFALLRNIRAFIFRVEAIGRSSFSFQWLKKIASSPLSEGNAGGSPSSFFWHSPRFPTLAHQVTDVQRSHTASAL